MPNPEQAVRDAAVILHDAILAARAAGLDVQWPNRADDLPAIAISETGAAGPGQPLDLTEEERAKLPPLDPDASNDPALFVTGKARRK